jgi:hypothetical protein
MNQMLLFASLIFYTSLAMADTCGPSNRKALMTRYGYAGTQTPDSNSTKAKGNRDNQLRRAGDGHRYVRLKDKKGVLSSSWVSIEQPGSCAILGSNKTKIMGGAEKPNLDGKAINHLVEIKFSNGGVKRCCWDDGGSDSTADKVVGKNQVIIDFYDPEDEGNSIKDQYKSSRNICEVKLVGYCQFESKYYDPKTKKKMKPRFPQESAAPHPAKAMIETLESIPSGPNLLSCPLEEEMI